MIYVALLRGINVGGNRKIDMKKLATTFESAGASNVKTYINSGNIIFEDSSSNSKHLASSLENAIESDFGFPVKVLLRDIDAMKATVKALPETWQNNTDMKCDVMYLWEDFNRKNVLKELVVKPGIDEVKYVDGALLWRVDRNSVTKSGMLKIIGTDLYKQMTIRNCNTTRKLLAMMMARES
jgi:uncharacterized protein (DUF1697 family)